jgi:hypothetical protein
MQNDVHACDARTNEDGPAHLGEVHEGSAELMLACREGRNVVLTAWIRVNRLGAAVIQRELDSDPRQSAECLVRYPPAKPAGRRDRRCEPPDTQQNLPTRFHAHHASIRSSWRDGFRIPAGTLARRRPHPIAPALRS